MSDLNISNLLIASLLLLPGYVFLFVTARFSVPGGRVFRGRFIQLIAALVSSIFIFVIFDHSEIRKVVSVSVEDRELLAKHFGPISHIENEPILTVTLKHLLDPQLPSPRQNTDLKKLSLSRSETMKFLIYSILLLVTPFAGLLAALIAFLHYLILCFLRLNVARSFFWLGHFVVWLSDMIYYRLSLGEILDRAFRFTYKWILIVLARLPAKASNIFVNIYFEMRMFFIRIFIGVSLALLSVLAIFLVFLILLLIPLELFSYFYHSFFRLFAPASGDVFNSFKNRLAIPIIEIKNDLGILLKGRLLSYMPNSEDQIASISISHVMQYAKAPDKQLLSGQREAYIFPHFSSQMVVPYGAIKDFNLWYLPSEKFGAFFSIESSDHLERQTWYLKLYLHYNKVVFDFPKYWKFSVSAHLAPIFCSRLIEVLEEAYVPQKESLKPFIFRRKLKGLLLKFRPVFFGYLREHKKSFPTKVVERANAIRRLRELQSSCRIMPTNF